MRRYGIALILTSSIYAIVGVVLFYQQTHSFMPQKTSTRTPMSIMFYEPPKRETPIPLPSALNVPEKKIEPSKSSVAPKKIQTKQKKHTQDVAQKQPEKAMPQENVAQEVLAPHSNESIVKEKTVPSVEEGPLHVKQKQYLEALIKRIDAHKIYPKAAQKGHIEGNVLVEFTISPKGELLSCVILEGNHIFIKATEKAISQSFPYACEDHRFTSNITLQITLKYSLL